jgi:hypothetical protein
MLVAGVGEMILKKGKFCFGTPSTLGERRTCGYVVFFADF